MSGIMSQPKLTLWYSRCIVLVMDYSICWTVLWIVEISLQETLINDSRVEKLSYYLWTCLQHENASVLCCKQISCEICCEEDFVFLHKSIELCLTESNSILFFTNLCVCKSIMKRKSVLSMFLVGDRIDFHKSTFLYGRHMYHVLLVWENDGIYMDLLKLLIALLCSWTELKWALNHVPLATEI